MAGPKSSNTTGDHMDGVFIPEGMAAVYWKADGSTTRRAHPLEILTPDDVAKWEVDLLYDSKFGFKIYVAM